jgi:hypothetical protein
MEAQFISLNREIPKWVIDRFEESWAVLENSATHEIISLPIASLPKDIRPGSTLVKIESKWYVNEADSIARESRINERFARIKAKNKNK